jgi:hypothetical protein
MEQSYDEIKRWKEESDERLIKAATEDLYEYSSEIQKIIKSEVRRRKLDDVEFCTPSTPKNMKREKGGFFEPEKRGIKEGVVGGLIMIFIVVVWYFVALARGYRFFYPPILFVIGIYALLKGISILNIAGKQKATCPIEYKENRGRKHVGEVKVDKCRICDKKIDESEMAYVVDGELLCIECERKISESEGKGKLDDVEFCTPSTPKKIKSEKGGFFALEKRKIQKGVVGGIFMLFGIGLLVFVIVSYFSGDPLRLKGIIPKSGSWSGPGIEFSVSQLLPQKVRSIRVDIPFPANNRLGIASVTIYIHSDLKIDENGHFRSSGGSNTINGKFISPTECVGDASTLQTVHGRFGTQSASGHFEWKASPKP